MNVQSVQEFLAQYPGKWMSACREAHGALALGAYSRIQCTGDNGFIQVIHQAPPLSWEEWQPIEALIKEHNQQVMLNDPKVIAGLALLGLELLTCEAKEFHYGVMQGYLNDETSRAREQFFSLFPHVDAEMDLGNVSRYETENWFEAVAQHFAKQHGLQHMLLEDSESHPEDCKGGCCLG